MTRTIPHRELRNNSSEILRAVQAGESFTVTNHGRPIAKLVPVEDALPPLGVRPALTRGAVEGVRRVEADASIQETLDDMRGEH